MKRVCIFLVVVLGIFLNGCTGVKSFSAEVNKMTRNFTNFQKIPNGKVYSISTGMHDISVTHNGKIIYSKKIFIGNQETKIIKL